MTHDDIIKLAQKAGVTEEEFGLGVSWGDLERFAALVASEEREACAKVCEEPGWNAANWCAKAIRARGESK